MPFHLVLCVNDSIFYGERCYSILQKHSMKEIIGIGFEQSTKQNQKFLPSSFIEREKSEMDLYHCWITKCHSFANTIDQCVYEKHFRFLFGEQAPFKQTITTATAAQKKMRINGTSVLFIDKVVYTDLLFTLLPIYAFVHFSQKGSRRRRNKYEKNLISS